MNKERKEDLKKISEDLTRFMKFLSSIEDVIEECVKDGTLNEVAPNNVKSTQYYIRVLNNRLEKAIL